MVTIEKTMIASIQMLINENRKTINGKVVELLSEDELECLLSYYNSSEKPEIILCNSFDKYSNILNWRGKWYVVYDMHFTQLLSDLNIIFFFKYNEDDAYKVIAQVYAEELFLKSKFVKSSKFIDSYYRRNRKKYCIDSKLKEIMRIQEAFIISHELAHWFFFRIQTKEQANKILNKHYDKCRGYFEEIAREKTESETNDQIVNLAFNYYKVNPKIQEESYCDISAISYLLAHFKALSNLNSIEIASATYIALYALQMIGFVKYSVKSYTDNLSMDKFTYETNTEVMDLEIMLRELVFLKYLEEYFDRFEKEQADEYKQNRAAWIYKWSYLLKDKLDLAADLLFSSDEVENNKEYDVFSEEWEREYRKIEKILSEQ